MFESVDQRGHDARTARTERVTDGDGTAVDVRLGQISPGVMRPGQCRLDGVNSPVARRRSGSRGALVVRKTLCCASRPGGRPIALSASKELRHSNAGQDASQVMT